jgi:uncharacterized protein (TIGR03086 family)
MDAKELFHYSTHQSTQVVNQVQPEYFDWPTPDTDWDVRTLVGHMLYELSWAKELFGGKTIAEVGNQYEGNLLGEDLSMSWHQATQAASDACMAAEPTGLAHLSYGDTAMPDYMYEVATDLIIHSWDLAAAIGVPLKIDPQPAQFIYDRMLPRQAEMVNSGLFAEPVPVDETADIQTKLLALYGRDANWQKR